MIHKLLNLTRPLITLDTETTGLDVQKDRIVELGFKVWTTEGLKSKWRSYVNPGVPIPPESTETHGITDSAMLGCRLCGRLSIDHPVKFVHSVNPIPTEEFIDCDVFKPIPTFAQIAVTLAKGFSGCDFAGKNVRFDLRILDSEFARAKVEWSYVKARIVDADALERLLNPRDLSTLYKKYTGRKLEDAHGAMADVEGAEEVIYGQLRMDTDEPKLALPRDLDALHDLQWPGWIDVDGKFWFDKRGVPCFTRWGKHALRPMREADNGYWDFILKSDFGADVKRIAADAKLGRFPVKEMK